MLQKFHESDRQAQLNWNMKRQPIPEFMILQREYFNELSRLADIETVPEVYHQLALYAVTEFFTHPVKFRNYKLTVIDDEHYTREWQGD